MKKLFLILLTFSGCLAIRAQQSSGDKEKVLQGLIQSGYFRQDGNTLILKAKKASDTAQAKLIYGTLFANTKYSLRFEVDGKYFESGKTSAVKAIAVQKPAPYTKDISTAPLATTAQQLYLGNGSFLIKSARDYRYITLPRLNDGIIPVMWEYVHPKDQNYWKFILQPGGLYKIKTNNGLFLQEFDNGRLGYGVLCSGIRNGNAAALLWRISGGTNGISKIVSNSGKYLTVNETTITEGTKITLEQNPSSVANAQYWHLIKIEGPQKVITPFNPVQHGFHFANAFTNTQFWAGGVEVSMAGRCAGMIWSALDYYYNNVPIPPINTLPNEGSTLSTYIALRQERSTHANIDDFAEVILNPFGWRTTEIFNWGLQGTGNGKMQRVKSSLDAGKPVPLMLYNQTNLFAHHSVLAIGYSMERYLGDLGNFKEDFKLYVYDPNFPEEIKVLIPDLSNTSNPRYFYPNEGGISPGHGEWLTYFPTDGYVAQSPLNTSGITNCPEVIKQITGKSYRGTTHNSESFKCAVANHADFYGATFRQVDFENAQLDSTEFYGANLRNTNFTGASLTGSNFEGADLKDTRFTFATASNANFRGADMKLAQLIGGSFLNCKFYGADLHRTNLTGANFAGTDFSTTSLTNSICENVNFSNTTLTSPNFQHANLRGAAFRNARLYNVDFRNADLTNADFTGAFFWGAPSKFDGAKLEGVIGLPR
jgi:uncharacterized protein YjbI with pentapeptide repeats